MSQGLVEIIALPSAADAALFSKRSLRAVQLYIAGQPVLGLEDGKHTEHPTILRRVLDLKGVSYGQMPNPMQPSKGMVPCTEGEGYRVAGMGTMTYNAQRRSFFSISGSSYTYGIEADPTHEALVKQAFMAMGWKVY